MKNKYGIFLILAAASLWGAAGIFVRGMKDAGLGEMHIVFARAFFSSIILALVILIKDRTLFV